MRRASSAPLSRRRKQHQDREDQQQLPLVSSGPIRKQKSRRRKRRIISSKGNIFHTIGFVIFALVSLYGFFIMTVFALHLLSKLSFMSPSSSSMSPACHPVYFWVSSLCYNNPCMICRYQRASTNELTTTSISTHV